MHVAYSILQREPQDFAGNLLDKQGIAEWADIYAVSA
jgi:hypothetical protein